MVHIDYNKLVRDRIPEIIREQGHDYSIEIMSDADFELALREKLVEEAVEVKSADIEHLVTELADLQEVITHLMSTYNISQETLEQEQQKRHLERGGFEKKIRLLWTE